MTSTSFKKLNGNITLVKFIFCLCIVMLHYFVPWRFNNAFMVGGYIYVDFFFILQGFYLEDVLKHLDCEHAEREYAVSRIKRFFPIVAVQGLVLLVIEILFFSESIRDMALSGIGTLYQISFISVLLDKNLLNNGTMWFLSAYVIGGALVVFAIRRDAKGCRILAPIVSAMIYNYIIHTYGNVDAWWEIGFAGCLQYALPRAIAGISLGYFARGLYEWLADSTLLKCRWVKASFDLVGGGINSY